MWALGRRGATRYPSGMRFTGAWVAAAIVTAATPAGAGTLTGLVRYAGTVPALPALTVNKDQATCGASVPDESLLVDGGRLANAVVVVKGAPAAAPVRASLDQQRCRYVPHVQAVPVGSTLVIGNGDPILHSVHGWEGRRTRFEAVTPDRGAKTPAHLDRPGSIQVRCDVHAWMRAWVVVADAPAAVTGPDGAFTIRDLPAGTYTVAVWHERAGERSGTVTIPAQGDARADFTLGE